MPPKTTYGTSSNDVLNVHNKFIVIIAHTKNKALGLDGTARTTNILYGLRFRSGKKTSSLSIPEQLNSYSMRAVLLLFCMLSFHLKVDDKRTSHCNSAAVDNSVSSADGIPK